MDFRTRARLKAPDSIVSMINIVFLLLIFFLLTATLRPPSPFDVRVPQSEAHPVAEVTRTLHVSATGDLAWGDLRGEAVFPAIAAAADEGPVLLRADRALPGPALARVLARLGAIGVGDVRLVVGLS